MAPKAAEGEPPPILRFPVSEQGDEFFLLEATPYGSKPLDVKLRGSEGSAVFAAKREFIVEPPLKPLTSVSTPSCFPTFSLLFFLFPWLPFLLCPFPFCTTPASHDMS